mmetsp:Transcript_39117/g.101966  ORF Transcript_39117/g.101966 Transcript_39117/m.101966 type:complete len:203 (-) Transcript_39117:98-706(-)
MSSLASAAALPERGGARPLEKARRLPRQPPRRLGANSSSCSRPGAARWRSLPLLGEGRRGPAVERAAAARLLPTGPSRPRSGPTGSRRSGLTGSCPSSEHPNAWSPSESAPSAAPRRGGVLLTAAAPAAPSRYAVSPPPGTAVPSAKTKHCLGGGRGRMGSGLVGGRGTGPSSGAWRPAAAASSGCRLSSRCPPPNGCVRRS